MKNLLLITFFLCFTNLVSAELIPVYQTDITPYTVTEHYVNTDKVACGVFISLAVWGISIGTPYGLITGTYFLFKSSDKIAEIKGYK
ncbi:MAG: hypothetical protein PHX21_13780 [bacterium]|nr:hypothetical protein [bacterium]